MQIRFYAEKIIESENQVLLNKRPSCCSLKTNIPPKHHVEFSSVFRLINIHKFNESLIFIVLQLFTYKPEKVESCTWEKKNGNSLSQMLYKIGVCRKDAKFPGKHYCQSFFLMKLQIWSLQLYSKTDSSKGIFLSWPNTRSNLVDVLMLQSFVITTVNQNIWKGS